MARQIRPINIVSPGALGLNYAQSGSILSPQYSIEALNAVIDEAGRIACRNGQVNQTTTTITGTPNIESLFEYIQKDGDTVIISAWDGGIGDDITDPENNDISGSVTDTDGTWWFQNFNDYCLGFQDGQKLIAYSGTGAFATVTESSGTAPTGGIAFSGFGRVWQLGSDGQTIYYSGLLDHTDWGSSDSGSIDMTKIWTQGMDSVKGIAAYNGTLVVWGLRHIVFWADGKGSQLGLDPTEMYVVDIIEGTGLVDQQTIQRIGETEMFWLAPTGVQAMSRVIQEKSNPVVTISKKLGSTLSQYIAQETFFRSTYSPVEQLYILTFGDKEFTWVFDEKRRYSDEDGDQLRVITRWDILPKSWLTTSAGDIYSGGAGVIHKYSGDDDAGTPIAFKWHSAWLDFGEEFADLVKILKRLGFILVTNTDSSIVFKWFTDFSTNAKSVSHTLDYEAPSEWGVAEWGIGEWGAGLQLTIVKKPASGTGQYFRIAVEGNIDGAFAVQQAELFAKLGRLA